MKRAIVLAIGLFLSPIHSLSAQAETANTLISAVISGQSFTFEISHPESAVCSNFIPSSPDSLVKNHNCNIPMRYRVISQTSGSFYGNGKVYSEAGVDVGFFGTSTFLDRPSSDWKNSNIYVSMPSNGSVFLFFTGAGNFHTYSIISRKSIQLRVKTSEEVAAEKAEAERAAAERAAAQAAREQSVQNAKKLSITCIKGKSKKQVIDESPTCPKGFTNPLGKYLTFKAFSKCKLYKKDSPYGGARLSDGGRTLVLDSIREYNYSLDTVSNQDLACVKKVIEMPAFVESRIEMTRAIDGLQTGKWGKLSAFWTYHPDSGLNISINSR